MQPSDARVWPGTPELCDYCDLNTSIHKSGRGVANAGVYEYLYRVVTKFSVVTGGGVVQGTLRVLKQVPAYTGPCIGI